MALLYLILAGLVVAGRAGYNEAPASSSLQSLSFGSYSRGGYSAPAFPAPVRPAPAFPGPARPAPIVAAPAKGYPEDSYNNPNPAYKFNYAITDGRTGDQHTQEEERQGDTVKGSYSLVEPDGSIRKVEYVADHKNGFNAHITRIPGGGSPEPAKPEYAAPVYH